MGDSQVSSNHHPSKWVFGLHMPGIYLIQITETISQKD